MIRFLLLIAPATLLSGCLKITDIPKEGIAEAPQALAPIEVVAQAEANHYLVQLAFRDDSDFVQRLEKSNDSAEATAALRIPFKIQAGVLIDNQVVAGHHYIYQIGKKTGENFEVTKTHEVQIPIDLSIQQEMSLSKDEMWTQYARIFFGPKGVVTTNGHQLFVQADRMNSEAGMIRTFAGIDNGTIGGNGLSGGNIQILLNSGAGILKMEMRGQDGGSGSMGMTLPADPPFVYESPILPPGSHGMRRYFLDFFTKVGGPGGPGGAGGSSGRFQISIYSAHSLKVEKLITAGRGGLGGMGGAPQPLGGFTTSLGLKGSDGAPGADGTAETSCFRDPTNQNCL